MDETKWAIKYQDFYPSIKVLKIELYTSAAKDSTEELDTNPAPNTKEINKNLPDESKISFMMTMIMIIMLRLQVW